MSLRVAPIYQVILKDTCCSAAGMSETGIQWRFTISRAGSWLAWANDTPQDAAIHATLAEKIIAVISYKAWRI